MHPKGPPHVRGVVWRIEQPLNLVVPQCRDGALALERLLAAEERPNGRRLVPRVGVGCRRSHSKAGGRVIDLLNVT